MDKNEQRKEAGAKLRELRNATKLSVFKVGKAIGMSGNYISEIERGKRPASDVALTALADLYGVDKKVVFGYYGYSLLRKLTLLCKCLNLGTYLQRLLERKTFLMKIARAC